MSATTPVSMVFFSGNRQRFESLGKRLGATETTKDDVGRDGLLLGYAADQLIGVALSSELNRRRGWRADNPAWFLPDFTPRIRAPGRDPLLRAISHQTESLVDCTAGWCTDALHCARAGMQVTAVERHPIVHALIVQAEENRNPDPEALPTIRIEPGEATDYLRSISDPPEVIYLDPMYPPRPGNAAPKRPMQLLQALQDAFPDQGNPANLLHLARRTARRRVVVKRPHYAEPLGPGRSGSVDARLVRFDLYPPLTSTE